jgi:dolichol-phosphate mannosyltransferase
MTNNKKLISIITPVYNEEKTIDKYYSEITATIDNLSDKYDFEIIITDNCSTDSTFEKIRKIAAKDKRVRAYSFSKNFGYQKSIFTGYSKCNGDAAIEIDCDLQDPPSLIGEFLKEWEAGNKIVYGIRIKRRESAFVNFLRKLFYRLISKISDNDLPYDAGDFMLIDRRILNLLKKVTDHNLYLRGIIFSFGFKRKGIHYARDERKEGESKFRAGKMITLALDGIISQSILPLRLASFFGVLVSCLTFIICLTYILVKLYTNVYMPAGFTTIIVAILFSTGMNAIFLGIMGEYMARIYTQQKNNQFIIIEESIEETNV